MSTLKELTAEKHKEAEAQSFLKSIFAGEVDYFKYVDYLYQLLYIYRVLEELGDKKLIFTGMESIKRSSAIEQDYTELMGDPPYPVVKQSTQEYVDYLYTIADDGPKLLAHIYVRHMGDLFGGQQLAKLLPGPNNMYKFDNIPELIKVFRAKCGISLADEANKAFDYNIKILKEYD
jgi:heme oxygenase